MNPKEAAAREAVRLIQNGMTVGLGSGTTATFAIRLIGERIQREGLDVRGVPTSSTTDALAEEVGIPLVDLSDVSNIDITIDGADEVDPAFNLIKGGGGALVREKLVALASRSVVIICDESKLVPKLGKFPLPVSVVSFGWHTTRQRLIGICPDLKLRIAPGNNDPFTTDDGCHIIDLQMGLIDEPLDLEARIKAITGVVEVGIFANVASQVVVGYPDGTAEVRRRPG